MTNVAISISSDVSRSLSSLLPFLPAKTNLSPFFFPSALFSETREEAREGRETRRWRRKQKREVGRGISIGVVENWWPRVEFRCLSNTSARLERRSIGIHERFIRVKRPTRNIVGFRLGAILR